MGHGGGDQDLDHLGSSASGDAVPPAVPPAALGLWVSPWVFALAVLVLASSTFYVIGLAASGVTWTDGDAAYGVAGADVSEFLPPGVSHLVGGVLALALVLGPWVAVPAALSAAWRLRWWRRGAPVDPFAVGTLVVVGAFVVLMALWGDELWVWALD